jgi:hypothetical protein
MPLLRSQRMHELVGLASLGTLRAAAKAGLITDSEERLAEETQSVHQTSSPDAKLLLAAVQWHTGDSHAALTTLDELEALEGTNDTKAAVKALSGWVALAQCCNVWAIDRDPPSDVDEDDMGMAEYDLQETAHCFDDALLLDSGNVEVRFDSLF